MPALVAQGVFLAEVARFVSLDLVFPPCAAGFRDTEVRAVIMPVPEAAVDENHGAVFREDDVGPAGEGFVFRAVDGEAVAEAVEHRAQGELRLRVSPTDARHDLGALLRGEDVGHGRGSGFQASDASESLGRK